MNPIIVSTIIASATFIVAIFSANWLNQRHAEKLTESNQQNLKLLLEQMEKRFDSKIDGLRELMEARFDGVYFRLDANTAELGEVKQRVQRLEDILFKPSLR
jgi:RNA binding exosome subunit